MQNCGALDGGSFIRIPVFDITSLVDIVIVVVDDDGPSVTGAIVVVATDYRLKTYIVSSRRGTKGGKLQTRELSCSSAGS